MASTLDELAKLMGGTTEKRDALQQLAAQQVQQPTHASLGPPKHGLSRLGQIMGIGASPEQRQYMLRTLGAQRQPGETRMNAWSRGMLKADELALARAQAQKQEQMQAAALAAQGAQQDFQNGQVLYNAQQQQEAQRRQEAQQKAAAAQAADKMAFERGKVGYQNIGDHIWQVDGQNQPIKMVGLTEGALNRAMEQMHREEDAAEARRQSQLDGLDSAKRAAQNASDIQDDIAKIRRVKKNVGETGLLTAGASYIWGTDSYDLRTAIDGVKAKLGKAMLQELRAAASSGASGYGNLTERELTRLEEAVAGLRVGMGDDLFTENMATIDRYYQRAIDEYEALRSDPNGPMNASNTGYSPNVVNYLLQAGVSENELNNGGSQ